MDKRDIEHRFAYHRPDTQAKQDAHAAIRAQCGELAQFINETVPDGREKSTAMTKLEEVMMWANAGLARDRTDPLAT